MEVDELVDLVRHVAAVDQEREPKLPGLGEFGQVSMGFREFDHADLVLAVAEGEIPYVGSEKDGGGYLPELDGYC